MLCEKCGKNEAVYNYSENINGKKKTLFLCRDCAPSESALGSSILSSLFGAVSTDHIYNRQRRSDTDEKKCPVCGIGLYEIGKTGKVGCAECYRTFRSELSSAIKRIHGNAVYRGSTPKAHTEKTENNREEQLRRELKEAIDGENYERAAALRDELRSLAEKKEG